MAHTTFQPARVYGSVSAASTAASSKRQSRLASEPFESVENGLQVRLKTDHQCAQSLYARLELNGRGSSKGDRGRRELEPIRQDLLVDRAGACRRPHVQLLAQRGCTPRVLPHRLR